MYPETPSPFVIIGENGSGKESREVWNLVTGAKGGILKGQTITGNNLALSPDGKYFASFGFNGGGAVDVYDIPGKKSLGVLTLDAKKFNVAGLALPSSKRLVAVSNVNTSIITWKLPSGDVEHQITLTDKAQPDPRRAFSPGGRYMDRSSPWRSISPIAMTPNGS